MALKLASKKRTCSVYPPKTFMRKRGSISVTTTHPSVLRRLKALRRLTPLVNMYPLLWCVSIRPVVANSLLKAISVVAVHCSLFLVGLSFRFWIACRFVEMTLTESSFRAAQSVVSSSRLWVSASCTSCFSARD